MREKLVAIAPFLRTCPQVNTLGIRASMRDYTLAQRRMLVSAGQILFPTPRFVTILEAAGKKTFPSSFSYSIPKSRLLQEVLFQFLKCPHPRTRIYYGRQKSSIVKDFSFPFRAMGPKMAGSAWLVPSDCDLRVVSEIYNPLIIQEAVDYWERFRLVFVNYQCVGVVKRASAGNHDGFDGCEISSDTPSLDQLIAPESFSGKIVPWLEKLLRSVQINDVCAEIGITREGWHLIELARPPLSWPTPEGVISRFNLLSRMIESNDL